MLWPKIYHLVKENSELHSTHEYNSPGSKGVRVTTYKQTHLSHWLILHNYYFYYCFLLLVFMQTITKCMPYDNRTKNRKLFSAALSGTWLYFRHPQQWRSSDSWRKSRRKRRRLRGIFFLYNCMLYGGSTKLGNGRVTRNTNMIYESLHGHYRVSGNTIHMVQIYASMLKCYRYFVLCQCKNVSCDLYFWKGLSVVFCFYNRESLTFNINKYCIQHPMLGC